MSLSTLGQLEGQTQNLIGQRNSLVAIRFRLPVPAPLTLKEDFFLSWQHMKLKYNWLKYYIVYSKQRNQEKSRDKKRIKQNTLFWFIIINDKYIET